VRVHPSGAARLSSAAAFRVTFEVTDAGGVDPAEPLFEATFTGDCRPAAATGIGGVAETAAPGVPGLTAWPTVTRGGTALHLARPAEADGRIDLFDVTGRIVRSLPVRRGEAVRSWDGSGADGRPAAAGVYFARLAGTSPRSSARIIRVP
jgi:hypothetical protein